MGLRLRYLIVMLWGLPCFACDQAGTDGARASTPLDTQDCKVLLRATRDIGPFTDSWSECIEPAVPATPVGTQLSTADPPPPPAPPVQRDAAWCALLDPSATALEHCLIDTVTDTTTIDDPRCPRVTEQIALGDLAFFALSDRHPGLWERFVPEDPAQGARAFTAWILGIGRREQLQSDLREQLWPTEQAP